MFDPPHAARFDRSPPPAPNQLSWDELGLVNKLLADVAPGWSADLNHASADESTIVVTPEGANDLIGPAFVLYQSPRGFGLDQFRWDEYRKLGEYHLLSGALAAMRTRLASLRLKPLPEVDF